MDGPLLTDCCLRGHRPICAPMLSLHDLPCAAETHFDAMGRLRRAVKNAFIGMFEDAINVSAPVVKNVLGAYGTAATGESDAHIPVPKPAPTNLYAIPESQVLKTNTMTPFKNEAEMMSKLADVLLEMK